MTPARTIRSERRPPIRRRECFVAIGLALSGLLLAACPSRNGSSDRPSGGSGSGGGMYRRY